MHFARDVQKNSCFENVRRFPENFFDRVLFKQI